MNTDQEAEIIKRMAAAMATAMGLSPFEPGSRWTFTGEVSAPEAWLLYEDEARLQYAAHQEIHRWSYHGN